MRNNVERAFLHEFLDEAEEECPDSAALRDTRGRWTYAELAACSRQYAGWLRARGVEPGHRVVVHAAHDRRTVALLYACSRIGATFVPLGTGVVGAQRTQTVEDADPVLVLADETAFPRSEDVDPFSEVLADPLLPAVLMYTSGSTASPKAVVLPHRQMIFATTAIAERLLYRADDVVFCRLPLSFDYGLYQIFLTALAKAELVLAGTESDAGLLAAVRLCGATVVPIVPSLGTMLLRLAARDRQPTRIRLFTNTGEELPTSVIDGLREHFPGAGVQLMYGITECKRVTIAAVDGDRVRPGSVGLPLSGTEVRVVDASGNQVPAGTIGEIVVSGPHVMAGYWRAPEVSARVFRRDPETGRPLLHTGDFGCLDADGHLYFHGRRDGIFKQNGTRTSTVEIEAAARDLPDVVEAAVVPPNDHRDAVLCVVTTSTPSEVLRGLRRQLDPLKVPAICRIVEQLPRGLTGKIDRAALRTLVEERAS